MKVSVIIPVYNAASFVSQAAESALAQPEVAEVILIEDGSTDASLAVCQELAEKYDNIHLLRHPDGGNRGASASRNLGMKQALNEHIAFLDADDYYLPGRFKVAKEIFEADPECDGVYEAMGVHFVSEKARKRWGESNMGNAQLTTVKNSVPPEALFKTLIVGKLGYFSLCGLTIRKSALRKTGYMNENLYMHEDSNFMYRISAVAKLFPGKIKEPVVIRGVHENNRISKPRSKSDIYKDRMKMWKATYYWFHQAKLKDEEEMILTKILQDCKISKPLPFFWMNKLPAEFNYIIRLILLTIEFPSAIFKKRYWESIFSIKILPVFERNIRKLM
jgi:glycosyltransferase involved in cell wall biosynthesis